MPLWSKKLAEAFGRAINRGFSEIQPGQTRENIFDPYWKHIQGTEKFAETGDVADLKTTDVGKAILKGEDDGIKESYRIYRHPELQKLPKSEIIEQSSDMRLQDDFEKIFDEIASNAERGDASQNIRKAMIEDLQSGMDISDVFEKYRSF